MVSETDGTVVAGCKVDVGSKTIGLEVDGELVKVGDSVDDSVVDSEVKALLKEESTEEEAVSEVTSVEELLDKELLDAVGVASLEDEAKVSGFVKIAESLDEDTVEEVSLVN